jgi:CBS domain containing-hemolysin-like protein
VYGELLPKYLFFLAPNKLLHRGGPLFLVCFVLFWPFAIVLSWLGRLLERLLGEAPEEVRLQLARSEIGKLLDEGKEVGILRPAQRQLAQAVSDVAHHRVIRYGMPRYRLSSVYDTDTIDYVLQVASKAEATELLVTDRKSRTVEGYVAIGDLFAAGDNWLQAVRPLARVRHTDSHLSAIVKMQTSGDSLAEIIDINGRAASIVSMTRLMQPLVG